MSLTQAWSVNPTSKALFCMKCGSILDLPNTDDVIKCFDCPFAATVAQINQTEQVQSKVFEDKTSNLIQANPTMRRATVKEPCPKCDYPELRFYTMQMRSVDEGQTVFYECEKCNHTYSTNT